MIPQTVPSSTPVTARSRLRLFMMSSALVLMSGPAFAEETGLSAFNSYVEALRALGLEVENGAVNYDETSDTLTLTDSKMALSGVIQGLPVEETDVSDNDGPTDIEPAKVTDLTYALSMAAGTVTIQGLTHEDDTFSATSWTYSDDTQFSVSGEAEGKGRLKIEGRLSGAAVTNYDFVIPKLPAEDAEHKVSRWLPFVRAAIMSSYDETKVDTTAMTIEAFKVEDGNETLVLSGTGQVDGYRVAGVHDGKVEEQSIDRMTQNLKALEPKSGRMLDQVTSQGKTIYQNIDLGALIDLFDPAVKETGEKVTLIGSASAIDYESQQEVAPGESVKMNVDKTSFSDVTVVKRDSDVLALLDELLNNQAPDPEGLVVGALQFYRAFGIADARATGIALKIPDPDEQTEFNVDIKEMSMSDGIGEMMIVGFDAPELPGGASAKLDWAALGDVEFADFGPMKETIGKLFEDPSYAENNPLEVTRAFLPQSLGYEIEGLSLNFPDTGEMEIGKTEFNISTTVPPIPTSLYAKTEGLKASVENIDDEEAQALFQALGLTEVQWSNETRLYWDEATKDLTLERIMIDVQGFGRAELSAKFANVPKELFEDPKGQGQVAAIMAQFVNASLVFKDDGLAAKGLPHMAEKQGIPTEVFRAALVGQAVEASRQIGNDNLTAMVQEQATKFLENPGTLKVTLSPEKPVPFAQILGSIAAPQTLPDLLNVNIVAD